MEDVFTPHRAQTEIQQRRAQRATARPDRFALWAVVMAVVAMLAGLASSSGSADASGGGITTGGGGTGTGDGTAREGRYASIWEGYNLRTKRWARNTSECESGGDPDAIGGGGAYRGA